jgi:glycosyltransferase involved in cell wall biosynthesis
MTQPQVSVILPVYNGVKYLQQAVDSVIAQTLQPAEILLVDDGSTDGSRELIESIETPFAKHVLFQENRFQSAARNLAASVATGKYLAFIDHDDIWYTHHLERLVALMEADPRLGWTYTDIDEMDEGGGLIGVRIIKQLNPSAEHPKTNLINMLSGDMYIFPSVSVVRRDAFLKIGGFDERLSGYEDDDLYLRLFRSGWLNDFIPESGGRYRRYTGSCAFSERMWLSREIFAEKLMETYPDDRELVRFYVRDVIAPRFFSHAKEEYWRHFPLRRWDLCLRSLELMRRFSALSHLPVGTTRLRRFIGFQILAQPRLFEWMYPLLRRVTPLPRFIMRPD